MTTEPTRDTVATGFYDEHYHLVRIEKGVLGNGEAKEEEWYYRYFSRDDLLELQANAETVK